MNTTTDFVWPSDRARAESDELDRVCEYLEETLDKMTDSGLEQRSDSWLTVVSLLRELVPGFMNHPGTGEESALAAISALAERARHSFAPDAWRETLERIAHTPLLRERELHASEMREMALNALATPLRIGEFDHEKLANALHYPGCWDTAAYPDLSSAVWEVVSGSGCSMCGEASQTAQQVGVPEGWRDVIERAVEELGVMDESEGIAGWHLNGAVSPWDEGDLPAVRDELQALLTAAPTAPAVQGGGVPPKAAWRKRVTRWADFLDSLKTAPIPACQRRQAAAIKKQVDHYLEYGVGHDDSSHNGEQGGEWVRCDERLPTEADADCHKQVWVYNDIQKRVHYCEYWAVKACGYNWWMPTGLTRPQPPKSKEDRGHE